ncbi:mucin-5AC-like [Melanotaenia boesemani]|uniref:mucin-5AC-like n=1 Tax=Melanotaenia boesemani TaxID=1250792 RepID=UPI001C0501B3|nr:mucin-5AC-like [Melanotaenia boesemani]
MSFSHGASHASCREMAPGHIRAHPLDPQHSYVSVRTSASSYLPGHLITVTVRSARDFMGFLLQARSVEVTKSSARGRAGIKSMRLGLLLVGGSWILTPPGTHTLHCFSEDDTVTHSNKQRKRNLSFIWRAPDEPMGDVQFHITVVQSYFVYWAGVASAVVRDGSHRAWRGSNTTVVDEASTVFVFQEEKATSLQDLIARRASKKQRTRITSPATTSTQWTKTSSRTQISKFLKTFTDVSQLALTSTSSVTLSNHPVSKGNNLTLGSRQSEVDTTPASLSSVTEEMGIHSVSHTNDPKSSLPCTTSIVPADVKRMDASTTLLPNTTEQISISPLSPPNPTLPFFPLSDVETERKEPTTNSLEPKLNTDPELKAATLTLKTTTATSTIHSFHSTNTPIATKQRRPTKLETQTRPEEINGPTPSESLISTIQAKKGTHIQMSSSKPVLKSHSNYSEGAIFSQSSPKPQTSPAMPVLPPNTPTLSKSFPTLFLTQAKLQSINKSSGPKSTTKQTNLSQTATSLNSIAQSQSLSSFHRSVTETTQAQDEALTQSSVTPRLVNAHFFTSRFDPVFTLGKDLKSQSSIKTASADFGIVPSASPSPSFSTFPGFESSSPSTDSYPTASMIHPSVEPPLHPFAASTLVHPSVRSTLLTHSSSPSLKSQLKTAPALSAVPSPSPIPTPHQLSSAQPSSASHLPFFFTSTAIPSSNTSSYPSPASLFSSASVSTLPPFNSSQCITNATSSSATSFNMVPAITSSSLATSTSAPSFFSPTSTSSFFKEGSSSSFTSSDLRPSPVPHHSLHTSPTSSLPSVLSHKITVGHPNFNPPKQRTVVHPNPKPHPNLRLNHGPDFKPKILSVKPSKPAETPNKEGKYPEIIPRHSSWELGMLLGCSAGLGMVLVIGVRYVYRQACGRRTEVTLNDREREYERGDRALIQVQECGDLVRVRKIRENSFVLLTEYDVVASPGS